MAVAKSYVGFEQIGEPFKENGRMYINVRTPKGEKKVRWYTDAEYAKMYPNAANNLMDFDARHAIGFREGGYVTLYSGNTDEISDFVETHRQNFWGNMTFGYYTPAHIDVPELPLTITPIRLNWSDVQDHDNIMKPWPEVEKIVAEKMGKPNNSGSQYQGTQNDWLERDLVVQENNTRTDHFGDKHMHTMIDANGNVYYWETGAKNIEVGRSVHLKMKVKAHQEIKGVKTTVVWYCKEV